MAVGLKLLGLVFFLFPALVQAELKTIKIGLASNFSEDSSTNLSLYGDYFRNGVQLALKHSEKALAQKGLQIQLQEFDYGSNPVKVLEAAKSASRSEVLAVIGYNFSTHALLAAPIHQSTQLPMLTPSATADRVGQFGSYVHMGCFNNSFMGASLAKFAYHQLKARKAAQVVAANSAYSEDLAHSFTQYFQAKKDTSVLEIRVLDSDVDFSHVISTLKKNKVDVIVIPNHELISARIVAALLDAGIQANFLGGDGWGNSGEEFFSVINRESFKGYSISHWSPDLPSIESKKFLSDYQAEFHKLPDDSSVLAYEAMSLMIKSILTAKALTRDGIEQALNALQNFRGVTGNMIFSKNAAPSKTLALLEASKKQFKVIGLLEPGRDQIIPVNGEKLVWK